MVEPIGVLMAMLLLLRRRLRTRHRIAISVLRNDGFFLLLLLLLRLLWRLLQRFSVRNRINRTKSSYERCFLMFVRPVMIVPGMIMVMMVVTRMIVPMMVMMTVRQ